MDVREDLLARCKINDLIENYGEMFEYLMKLSKLNTEITLEDVSLITRCIKCYIGQKRSQYRKVLSLMRKDKLINYQQNSLPLDILRKKLYSEVMLLCTQTINLCDKFYKSNRNSNVKVRVFFLKTIADHYRYISEISKEEEKKLKAKEYYEETLKLIRENRRKFASTDIIYLTFFLNYTVFLHDLLGNEEEAISLSNNCLNEAIRETKEIVDESKKDIILLCQMMKDNVSLWKSESGEKENDNENKENEDEIYV